MIRSSTQQPSGWWAPLLGTFHSMPKAGGPTGNRTQDKGKLLEEIPRRELNSTTGNPIQTVLRHSSSGGKNGPGLSRAALFLSRKNGVFHTSCWYLVRQSHLDPDYSPCLLHISNNIYLCLENNHIPNSSTLFIILRGPYPNHDSWSVQNNTFYLCRVFVFKELYF